jgi:hypothetical protein
MAMAFVLVGAAVARGDNKPAKPAPAAAPAPPPEVKKTVDAWAGKWTLQTTLTPKGAPPIKFTETIDCKRVALGVAVSCIDSGSVPGAGSVEYAFLGGYDPESKAVHMFVIGSSGEVHDHKCPWKGKTMECELYKGTKGGKPLTELVAFTLDGDTLTVKGKVIDKDGETGISSSGTRAK